MQPIGPARSLFPLHIRVRGEVDREKRPRKSCSYVLPIPCPKKNGTKMKTKKRNEELNEDDSVGQQRNKKQNHGYIINAI